MTTNRSAEIKEYITKTFVQEDKDLLAAKEHATKNGIPPIAIPENVGKLLYFLVKLHKPKRILEIGTLAGYSTLWLAKGAPDAELITLEYSKKHASVARENLQRSQHASRIKLLEGDAFEILKQFKENGEPPFDLIFLDAYNEGYPSFLPLILDLSRPGTLLLTDNLIPKEAPINHPSPDDLEGVNTYQYNQLLATNPRLETILSTTIVGERGRIDALGISLVL